MNPGRFPRNLPELKSQSKTPPQRQLNQVAPQGTSQIARCLFIKDFMKDAFGRTSNTPPLPVREAAGPRTVLRLFGRSLNASGLPVDLPLQDSYPEATCFQARPWGEVCFMFT